jgi:pimeloyl-ACP methyl ester carboxylesterase
MKTDPASPGRGSPPGVETQIRVADGRRLAVCEYGAPGGAPAFFFHGWPGSRLDFAANDAAAKAAGVRVIAIDRPGIGGSDPQPRRKVLDWPADVTAVADSLGLDRFTVFGFSFGGPYARAARTRCRTGSSEPALSHTSDRSTIPPPNAGCQRPRGTLR